MCMSIRNTFLVRDSIQEVVRIMMIIGASLSEPHIVVISITFSCPIAYAYTSDVCRSDSV